MDRSRVIVLLGTVGVLLATACLSSGEDLIGFNEDPDENPYRQNAYNRTPIYIPGRCGNNEILYPGDNLDDWVCDCRPAHVYYPPSGGCFPLYTQAYCAKGEYVEMRPGAQLPQCTKNICPEKQVPYTDKCVVLHKNNQGACPKVDRISYVIGVNETTLQLACISNAPINLDRLTMKRGEGPMVTNQHVVTKEGNVYFLTATKCAVGSAARVNGTCPS